MPGQTAARSARAPGLATPDPLPARSVPGGEDDARLVARVLEGDADRYAVLVQRYQDTLFRYAVGMVRDGDLAADLVQEALVRAYVRLESCQDPARFGAWVYRILVNRCKDHLKSPRRARTVSLEEAACAAPSADRTDAEADRAELRRALEEALATLPETQRHAFLLKHVEGLSYEEMAGILDASVGALKMRVMRAREGLRDALRSAVAE